MNRRGIDTRQAVQTKDNAVIDITSKLTKIASLLPLNTLTICATNYVWFAQSGCENVQKCLNEGKLALLVFMLWLLQGELTVKFKRTN